MATWNEGFVHGDHPVLQTAMLPPWLSTSSGGRPASPSVTLSLASSTVAAPDLAAAASWLQHPERRADPHSCHGGVVSSCGGEQMLISELLNGCRELEEGSRALAANKKEAVWRLNRVELQLESEKASRRREKMEEIEAKIRALKEEEKACLERIETEYREQLLMLRRDAEGKEQKLVDQWTSKHIRFVNLLEQIGGRSRTRLLDAN